MSAVVDDGTAAELEDDDGPMNTKSNGFGAIVAAALIATGINLVVNRTLPDRSSDDKTTVAAIATLTEKVSNLSSQVTKLTEQPYVRREEFATFENRVTGLEKRVDQWEQRNDSAGRKRGGP